MGSNALRRGRASTPYAEYFVTVCLQPRLAVLVPDVAAVVQSEAQRLGDNSEWTLRSLTVMPDHLHLFFILGERLTLSQTIARLKAKTQMLVRPHGVDWQDNFYDHKVRREDSIESIIRYIYLNPYRAGLIQLDECWPHFYCRGEDWAWFQEMTDTDQPFPEWLQ